MTGSGVTAALEENTVPGMARIINVLLESTRQVVLYLALIVLTAQHLMTLAQILARLVLHRKNALLLQPK